MTIEQGKATVLARAEQDGDTNKFIYTVEVFEDFETTPAWTKSRRTRSRTAATGFYAEASPDVYHLVEAAADRASMQWGLWGARSQSEMRAYLIAPYRREHLLRRRMFVGLSREALDALLQRQQLAPGARAAELGDARVADAMVGLWRDQARPVRAGGSVSAFAFWIASFCAR